MLNYRVYRMTPGETLLYTALAFILGGAAGLVFYGGLFSRDGKPTALTLIANVVVFVVAGAVASRVFLPSGKNSSGTAGSWPCGPSSAA